MHHEHPRATTGRSLAIWVLLVASAFPISLGGLSAQGPVAGTPGSLPTPAFQYGDIYLASVGLPKPGDPPGTSGQTCPSLTEGGSGIVRLDPYTGDPTLLTEISIFNERNTLAYDPFRDRLFITAVLSGTGKSLAAIDAQGDVTTPLLFSSGMQPGLAAPTGDGRVYVYCFESQDTSLHWVWFDSNDQRHELLDASGSAFFSLCAGTARPEDMLYDAQTNALLVVSASGLSGPYCTCPYVDPNFSTVCVQRLLLSDDGTRVLAVDSSSYQLPAPAALKDLDYGPGGTFVLFTNLVAPWPDLTLRLDPVDLSISQLCGVDPFVLQLDAGAFNMFSNTMLTLDTFGNGLWSVDLLCEASPLASCLSGTSGTGEWARCATIRLPYGAGPAASCTFRNGLGGNPADYDCVTPPLLGSLWETSISTVPVMGTSTLSTIVGVTLGGPTSGVFVLGWELLALPVAPFLDFGLGTHSLAVPAEPGLVGVTLATQGARIESSSAGAQIVLLNAQDLAVGY